MDAKQYLNAFIEEANEHLQALNQNLLELEKSSDDAAVIAEIFRSTHTLKGSSATMGFNHMARLTHEMENVLDVIQRKTVSVDAEMIDLLFKCIDAIESILNQVIDTGSEGDSTYEDIIVELTELVGLKPVSQEHWTESSQVQGLWEKTTQESASGEAYPGGLSIADWGMSGHHGGESGNSARTTVDGERAAVPGKDGSTAQLMKAIDEMRAIEAAEGSGNEDEAISAKILEIENAAENDPAQTNGINHVSGAAEAMLSQLNGGENVEVAELATLRHIFNTHEINVIQNAVLEDFNVFMIRIMLDKNCLMKSARAFIIFRAIEQNASIIKSNPGIEEIEDERFGFEFTVTIITAATSNQLQENLRHLSEIDQIQIRQIVTEAAIPKVPIGNDEEEPAESAQQDAQEISLAEARREITREEQKDQVSDSALRRTKVNKTVRVDINRLDVLLNLVSELIIQKTRLEGLELAEQSQTFTETVEYLERISTNLHDVVMKVRMVPIENVFSRFPKMVRDISRRLSREVDLVMSGQETELDRTVIDELGEPLLHILRNAIDHGIEDKEIRARSGKAEKGQIVLRAFQDGTNVVIEVQDDGCGINTDRVRMKAVESGRITADAVGVMTRSEINQLVFLPGFSTNDTVTDISGRGVGMDVVKTKIESLGGVILLDSEEKVGTRISIRLPLTLAMIQALLVQVGEDKYAIQLNAVHQIIKIPRKSIQMVRNQEVLILRDMIIPVMRLSDVLECPEQGEHNERLTIVVVKRGDKYNGLIVNAIIGQQEIVQKPLGKFFQNIKVVTGATILGDGKVSLILDVNALTGDLTGKPERIHGVLERGRGEAEKVV